MGGGMELFWKEKKTSPAVEAKEKKNKTKQKNFINLRSKKQTNKQINKQNFNPTPKFGGKMVIFE